MRKVIGYKCIEYNGRANACSVNRDKLFSLEEAIAEAWSDLEVFKVKSLFRPVYK